MRERDIVDEMERRAAEHGLELVVVGRGVAGLTYGLRRNGKWRKYSVTPARIHDFLDAREAAGHGPNRARPGAT